MATITHRVATASTTNAATYASGSFTPVVGELLVVFSTSSGEANAAPTMTASANSMTFALVGTTAYGGGATMHACFISDQVVPASPVAMTVTTNWGADSATGNVVSVEGVSSVTGVGTAAIVQSAKSVANTPAMPVFGAACQTGNPVLGAIGFETGSTTVNATAPSGWTELADTGYATPATGMEAAGINSGFTGTTPTWTGLISTVYATYAVELNGAAAVAVVPRPISTPNREAIHRSFRW